jgi:hypothetical protein
VQLHDFSQICCGKTCLGCHFGKLRMKVKVKLPLCSITTPTLHEDVWEEWGIAPQFLTSALDGNEWSALRCNHFTPQGKLVVSFKLRPLYPQGMIPWYPLDRRLSGP